MEVDGEQLAEEGPAEGALVEAVLDLLPDGPQVRSRLFTAGDLINRQSIEINRTDRPAWLHDDKE